MIVVDVNAIAYFWIPGDMTRLAEKAFERDPEWVSSILWRSEFRNILAWYLRRGKMDTTAAARCLTAAESQMNGHEYLLPSFLVIAEVARSRCSAYDCEYVALAKDLGVKLVTADAEVLRDFPKVAVSLGDFSRGR